MHGLPSADVADDGDIALHGEIFLDHAEDQLAVGDEGNLSAAGVGVDGVAGAGAHGDQGLTIALVEGRLEGVLRQPGTESKSESRKLFC